MSNQTPRIGYLEVVPNDKAASTKQSGPSTKNYELTNRSSNYDKQSGSYLRQTSKELYSSGDYSNRGKTGYKDEFKASSTVRVGDKGGYTEYYKQEKLTRVNYDSGSNSGGSKGYVGGNKGSNSNNDGNSDGLDDDDAACSEGNRDVVEDASCSDGYGYGYGYGYDNYGDYGCFDDYYDSDD